MKYILLNPAERFREVVEQARSVVLAGGTMEPVRRSSSVCVMPILRQISDFLRQLFPTIPPDRFSTLSCAHVIPKINLLTQVICQGPRKLEFEFKYANREDESLAAALSFIENALLISTKAGRARRGDSVNDRPCARRSGCLSPLICFSGQSQDKLDSIWSLAAIGRAETGTHCTSGQHGRLMRPKMFYEPKTSGDVDSVLRDYALAISSVSLTGAAWLTRAVGSSRIWREVSQNRSAPVCRGRRQAFGRSVHLQASLTRLAI
jgi:chromosome transmission fidelity protein 1